jgi:hypothetical protein
MNETRAAEKQDIDGLKSVLSEILKELREQTKLLKANQLPINRAK